MNENTNPDRRSVAQAQLDQWRAFAEQNRTDLFTLRQLISRGQGQAAAQLITSMLDQTIIAALDMEAAGANRPSTLPPRPTGADRLEAEREANE